MKLLSRQRLFQFAAILLLSLALAHFATGCGSTTKVSSPDASVGQQLLDLEKAHNEGVINDKEYAKLKKALVKKND